MGKLGVILVGFLVLCAILNSAFLLAQSNDILNNSELKIEIKGILLEVTTSDGKKHNVTLFPDQASEVAKSKLNVTNISSITLEEIIYNNVPKVVYKVQTEHEGRFLWIFKLRLKAETIIDPETKEVLNVKIPWWSFLVARLDIPEDLPKNGKAYSGGGGTESINENGLGNGNGDSGISDTNISSGTGSGGGGSGGGGSGDGGENGGEEIPPYCTDSDGGLNYSTKGYVNSSYNGSLWWDSCQNAATLLETACVSNVSYAQQESCQYGCSDGVCLETPYCADFDGGLEYFTRGYVNSSLNDTLWWDSCQDSNTLIETYCSSGLPYSTQQSCQYGCTLNSMCAPFPVVALTDSGGSKIEPDIYENITVWANNYNGNYNIYLCNITGASLEVDSDWCSTLIGSGGGLKYITNDNNEQHWARIDGDKVVWHDDRNGNWDIYMYNVTTGQETQITTDASEQSYAQVNGDKIVWLDYRNGDSDIYMYDLSTSQETQITSGFQDQGWVSIYDDKIVYSDDRNGNWDIYMYDLSTSQETQITTNSGHQHLPDIYEDIIVWRDKRTSANAEIFMYNLSSSQETKLTDATQLPYLLRYGPYIYEDTIAYQAYSYDMLGWDIYIYDLSTSQDMLAGNYLGNDGMGGIYGDKIVWWGSQNLVILTRS